MNQRPPMAGQRYDECLKLKKLNFRNPITNSHYTERRNLPFDGPVKGGGENFMANPGGFPSQQFPTNAMANGPQQVQMNGVSSQQASNRYHQQPKQPLPPKVTVMPDTF